MIQQGGKAVPSDSPLPLPLSLFDQLQELHQIFPPVCPHMPLVRLFINVWKREGIQLLAVNLHIFVQEIVFPYPYPVELDARLF